MKYDILMNGILENFMKKELDRCSKIMFPH